MVEWRPRAVISYDTAAAVPTLLLSLNVAADAAGLRGVFLALAQGETERVGLHQTQGAVTIGLRAFFLEVGPPGTRIDLGTYRAAEAVTVTWLGRAALRIWRKK